MSTAQRTLTRIIWLDLSLDECNTSTEPCSGVKRRWSEAQERALFVFLEGCLDEA